MVKRLLTGAILAAVLLLLGGLILPAQPSQAQQQQQPVISSPGTTEWIGLFWNNTTFSGNAVSSALYPNGLNFNWGTGFPVDGSGQPVPGINADNFSARFSAVVNLQPGLYEFIITADDTARLFINGNLSLQNTTTGLSTTSDILNMTGGAYNLTLEFVEFSDQAVLQFNWIASLGTPLPTATPIPVAQAEVVQVRGLSVRTGPFLGASMLAVARPGQLYDVLARNTQEGIFTWYKIQYDVDTVGWVSGRYLLITGFPQSLPLDNSTVFDVINQTPTFDVLGQTRSVMNFRRYPSPRVPRIPETPQIPWGAQIEILARTVQGGLDFWYQVRYRAPDGRDYYGWIFAPYIELIPESAPIDAVPIY